MDSRLFHHYTTITSKIIINNVKITLVVKRPFDNCPFRKLVEPQIMLIMKIKILRVLRPKKNPPFLSAKISEREQPIDI